MRNPVVSNQAPPHLVHEYEKNGGPRLRGQLIGIASERGHRQGVHLARTTNAPPPDFSL